MEGRAESNEVLMPQSDRRSLERVDSTRNLHSIEEKSDHVNNKSKDKRGGIKIKDNSINKSKNKRELIKV